MCSLLLSLARSTLKFAGQNLYITICASLGSNRGGLHDEIASIQIRRSNFQFRNLPLYRIIDLTVFPF